MNLQLTGDAIGLESLRSGQAVFIRQYRQIFGTVDEFARGAGHGKSEDYSRAGHRAVPLIFHTDDRIVHHALAYAIHYAFSLYDYQANFPGEALRPKRNTQAACQQAFQNSL
jgi:hypothetical protein